ncbi:MAG: hypothetical protein WC025_02100 [Candidatus Magasanikbacteria bacterium]
MKTALSKITFIIMVAIFSLSLFNLVYADTTSTEDNISPTSTEDIVYPTINLTIRYNDQIIFNDTLPLTTTTYHDDINNIDYELSTTTVFSALVNADTTSTNFDIADDQYNTYYQSFYLRCITLETSTTTDACDNWQYTVNGQYPYNSMDSYELIGNENVYIYFGDRYKLNTPKTEYTTDETITSTFQEYDFIDNTWQNAIDQKILLTEPIASDYSNWPPQIFASSTTNELGEVYFNQTTTGTYYITLPNDYWPGVTITVTSTISVEESDPIEENDNSQGGGSSPTIPDNSPTSTQITEAVNKILNYFKTQQNENGSIVDGSTSDWVAMSFAANNQYTKDIKNTNSDISLYDYIYSYNFSDPSDLNLCASYPRHIMALLASGVSKDDNKIIELKNKILSVDCYQNNQYGQAGINDDIFALISLLALDYDINSNIITDIKNTILEDQTPEGAFTWTGYAGADVTGAVINALNYGKSKNLIIEENVINNAKNYLKANQLTDGGWGYEASDILTTSWVILGLNSENENMSNWKTANNYTPLNPLIDTLQDDGTYDTSWSPGTVDWFGLKHTVPSLLGKTWPIILNTIIQPTNNTGGKSIEEDIIFTTTTKQIITSTLEIIENNINTSTPEIEPTSTTKLPITDIITTTSVDKKEPNPPIKPKNIITKNKPKEIRSEKIVEEKSTSTISDQKENLNKTDENQKIPLPVNKKVALGLGITSLLYGLFLILKIFV